MTVLREYQRREEEFLRRTKDLDETTTLCDAEKQKYDSLQSLWKKRLSMSLCLSPQRRRRVDSERLSMQVDALEMRSTTSPTSRTGGDLYRAGLIGEARH